MKPEKVFQRYDIRGIYPEEIDGSFAHRLGESLGKLCGERNYGNEVTVCRDNKDSSEELKKKIIEGLNEKGVDVTDIGVGPTDYLSYCSKRNSSVGVQVTSSHLPLNFNGFKMIYPSGNSFENEDLDELKDIFRRNDFKSSYHGTVEEKNFREHYINDLVSFASNFGDGSDYDVAVDTSGGATKFFIREILERMGSNVYFYKSDEDGIYRDPPHPGKNVGGFAEFVEKKNADIGFAFDLDGDRVRVYYGDWISGERILSGFTGILKGMKTVSVDSPESICERDDVSLTRVGDPFVLGEMVEEEAVFGGEPNGHYAFGNFTPYSSGLASAAVLLSMGPDEFMDVADNFETAEENLRLENIERDLDAIFDSLKQEFKVISTIDGIKIGGDNSEALIRKSGTEEVLRIKEINSGGSDTGDLLNDLKRSVR